MSVVHSSGSRKYKKVCVKCKSNKGVVRFPFSKEQSRIWSECIAVDWQGKGIRQFSGRNTNFLCQVCKDYYLFIIIKCTSIR
jgi:hypothetical protein